MARVLIAVSGIGMGHIARARVLAKLLEDHGAVVDVVAPPPTHRYLEAYSMKAHPASMLMESYSPVVDRFYTRSGRGEITLRMELEEARIARGNAKVLEDNVDMDRYDVVVADESWELLYTDLRRVSAAKVLITDFIYYPYRVNPLAALAFNRFMARRIRLFDALAFVGFTRKLCPPRWPPLARRRITDGTRIVASPGPIPPALEDEVLGKREALKVLGLEDPPVLALPGGTMAGTDIILHAAKVLASRGFKVASTLEDAPRGVYKIPGPLRYKIPLIIRGFSSAVTLAGLSTLSSIISTGLPTLVSPLPGHFEQEENAEIASRTYPWIRRVSRRDLDRIPDILGSLPRGTLGDRSLFQAPVALVKLILSLPSLLKPGGMDEEERDS